MGFIQTYFIDPIRLEQGYTYYNSVVYALVAFAAIWGLSVMFKKADTKIDFRFMLQLVPFIVIGSFLRILVDKREIHRAAWNVSPGIYILVAFLFLASYVIGLLLNNYYKVDNWLTVTVLGTSIFLGLLISSLPLRVFHLIPAGFIVSLFALLSMSFHLIFEKLNWSWIMKPLPFFAFMAQLFDATMTAFLVQFFGAVEKHPLPKAVIDFFGTGFAFYPLKIIVILLALYVITKDVRNKTLRNLLIVSIFVLGFAQGLRNLLGFIIF